MKQEFGLETPVRSLLTGVILRSSCGGGVLLLHTRGEVQPLGFGDVCAIAVAPPGTA